MNKLYAYRGWILGALAIILLAMPASPFPELTPETICSEYVFFSIILPTLVFASSVILRIQARRSIGEHTRGVSHDANRLVTDGMYSRIRHPLYVSNTGIAYSYILFHLGLSLRALPFVVVLVSFEILLAKMEDRYLESRFGDGWRKWAAVTPAFIPRLTRGSVSAEPLNSEKDVSYMRRSFFAAARADFSTWFWLAVAIILVVLRKTILNFNLLELWG